LQNKKDSDNPGVQAVSSELLMCNTEGHGTFGGIPVSVFHSSRVMVPAREPAKVTEDVIFLNLSRKIPLF